MKTKYLITLAFILAGVLFFSENLQAQKLLSGGKPKKSIVENFDGAYCVGLPGKFRICKVFDETEWKSDFIIQKGKEILYKFDAPSYAGIKGDDFWAYHGDLDKDDSAEIIIAALENITNGLGVKTYNIYVFHNPAKFGFQKPFTFPIEEFGEKGNFIFNPQTKETQILVTYWSWFDSLDKNRGQGTYLVGKWFRYRNGLLEPIVGKPTLARRLLYSFGDEIGRTQNNPYAPYLWLKSKNTHKFFAEPKDAAKLIGEQFGVIRTYQQEESKYERFLSIKFDSGETVEADLNYSVYGNKQNNRIPVTDLGLWKNKFVFPFRFNPYIILGNVEGRKVKLETHQDQYFNKYAKLWILEK